MLLVGKLPTRDFAHNNQGGGGKDEEDEQSQSEARTRPIALELHDGYADGDH